LEVLPIVEIVPNKEFFDFESRYSIGNTEYYIPARLKDKEMEKIKEVSLKAANP
jgi:D-alanine-D-alanine ligase